VKKIAATALLLILSFFSLSNFLLPIAGAVEEDSWMTLEPMPTARSGLGVTVVDGKIYAIGGTNGSLLGTNEMYDPVTDTWTTKTPMPTPRSSFAIAVYQNKIYVIGGMVALLVNTGVNEVYDPLTDTWETKSGMPEQRDGFCANVVNDKIYLISGYFTPLPPYHNSDKNYVYDPANDSWTTKAPIPTGVGGYASAVVDNKIYVIGGRSIMYYSGTDLIYNLTQIYDPETDTWSYGASIPVPVYGAGAGATTSVLAPKRIYVLGGDTSPGPNLGYTNLTQVYDPETDVWTTGTPMLAPRYGVSVAVVNDTLYAIGGYNDDPDQVAENEQYIPLGYIPEFPSWIILPLLFVATLMVIICKKRLPKNPSNI